MNMATDGHGCTRIGNEPDGGRNWLRLRGLEGLGSDEKVIVELKCVDRLGNEHLAQCINHLKASGLRVALLFNFQRSKVEWKRVLLDP